MLTMSEEIISIFNELIQNSGTTLFLIYLLFWIIAGLVLSLNLDSSPLFKTICLIIFEIIPGIFLTINVAAYPEGLENSIGQEKWWFHLLVLLFYLLTIFIMIFVEGEQMEDIVDSKGAKIGVKGGRMGLTILSVFLACYVFTCLGYLISLIF